MKIITKIIAAVLCTTSLVGCSPKRNNDSKTITIGIIEPLEHKAMNEIVAGFTDTLSKLYAKPVAIKVENAQSDANLERAIVQQMRDANYTFVVPIGVDATQMTMAMSPKQSIVSLASDVSANDRNKLHPCHVAVVHDEISSDQIMQFIHTVYPTMKHVTLIHSSANKVFPEVEEAISAGKKYGIVVDHKMVANLPELYGVSQSLPVDTQGIFVLKDSLIVSGVATLQKMAANKHIPLITSDQGSVQDGAGFAVGVHERQIGVEGAKLVAAVLNGQSICSLPIVSMKNLTVFVNKNSLQKEGQTFSAIENAAQKLQYKIEVVDSAASV